MAQDLTVWDFVLFNQSEDEVEPIWLGRKVVHRLDIVPQNMLNWEHINFLMHTFCIVGEILVLAQNNKYGSDFLVC